MCWFNRRKKDKEQIALLEQRVDNLELLLEETMNIVKDLYETVGQLAAESFTIKQLINDHIENDRDTTKDDDETTWEGY